jgi:hypothetical protein
MHRRCLTEFQAGRSHILSWPEQSTGLDQKQISNWSTNHIKRHWKPAAKDISYSMDMTMGGTEGEQREELLRRALCVGRAWLPLDPSSSLV